LQISGKLLGSSLNEYLSGVEKDSLINTIRVQKKFQGNLKSYLSNLSKKLPSPNYEIEQIDFDDRENFLEDEDFYRASDLNTYFSPSVNKNSSSHHEDSYSNEYGMQLPSIRGGVAENLP
jgi:hypothetical protein